MRKSLCILLLLCAGKALQAQTRPPYIYTIKADSVLITNSCDTAELIIENHTQNVPGFLFNKGRGRTEFRRVLQKINDTLFTIGIDTLKLPYAWVQGGNTWGTTGKFGTLDSNHIDFYTNNTQRARLTSTGNLLIGTTNDYGYNLSVNGATYSKYFTNSTTPLGISTSGALRLQWGGAEGSYIDFYNSHTDNARRGNISSPSDYRPLVFFDHLGLSTSGTPFLAVGSEGPINGNTKLSVIAPRTSTMDLFGVARADTNNSYIPQYGYPLLYSLMVKASGNTLIGNNNTDNGSQLQVNGSSYFNGTQQVTGTTALANNGAHYSFFPTVSSTGSDWSYFFGQLITPTLNFTGNNQQGYGVTIAPAFNSNGYQQQTDGISCALNVRSNWGGIRIDQSASLPGNTGQPLFISQGGTANKELIRNYRNYNSTTLPFIYNADNRPPDNRGSVIPALRSTISNINAGGGISFTMDRFYYGTEASIEMKYETSPRQDTGATINTSIGFYTRDMGSYVAPLYLKGSNVGIGTTTPTAQLQVAGSLRFSTLTNDNTLTRVLVSDVNGNLYYRDASSLALNDVHNSDLAINGTLSAQKMRITQTGPWPDYVFSNQYKLPTLLQLEQYIKQNNHLPDVPSATEVEKKGIDVGENQAALLRKIEELTLYAIDQEKKFEKQNEKIADQEKMLEKQNEKIADQEKQLKKQNEEMNEIKNQLKMLMQKN